MAINLVLSFASQGIGIIGQLLFVPAFLLAWGESLYGDWLTLSAVSSYLSLTDVGLQLYVINLLTGQAVRGDHEAFDRTVQSALFLYALLSSAALMLLFVLVWAMPWSSWFSARSLPGSAASEVVITLGVAALVSVWAGFVSALYRVHGEAQRTTAVGLALRIGILGATLVGLRLRLAPGQLAWLHLLCPSLILIYCAVDFRRRHGRPVFSLQHADRRLAWSFLLPSALFAVAMVANGLTVQGTLLLTSGILGPIAVTTFSTSRTLANAVRQVVSVFNGVAWPEFTRLDAKNGKSQLSAAHRLLVKISSVLTVWIVASLWFVGAYLYSSWTGGRAHFEQGLFRALLIHALLQTPWWCSAVLLTATNRHRGLAFLFLAQGVITLLVCPIALSLFGVAGVAAALLVTDFPLFGFLIPAWVQRQLGEAPGAYYRDIYLGLGLVSAAVMLVTWGVDQLVPTSLYGMLALVAAGGVPAIGGALLWIRGSERELLLAAGRALARRAERS